jgi:hypothetical protein
MSERQRLTTKKAGEAEDAYTLNGARPAEDKRGGNGSGEAFNKAYAIGDSNTFGETPVSTADTAKLNKEDQKRNDMNVGDLRLAFAKEIQGSQGLHKHASKALTASECMLPGAAEEVLAANAADLMFLPDTCLDSVLARQASLAQSIDESAKPEDKKPEEKKACGTAGAPAKEEPKPGDKPEEKKAGEEGKDGKDIPADGIPAEGDKVEGKEAGEDKFAAFEKKIKELEDKLSSFQAQAVTDPAIPATPAVDPAMDPSKDPAATVDAAAATPAPASDELDIQFGDTGEGAVPQEVPPEEGTPKTASQSTLESLFESYSPKVATHLPITTKTASVSEEDRLSSLWAGAPDVSSSFN